VAKSAARTARAVICWRNARLSLRKKDGVGFEFMRSSIQSALAIAVKVQKNREFGCSGNAVGPPEFSPLEKRR
jgi:hypothetical protein